MADSVRCKFRLTAIETTLGCAPDPAKPGSWKEAKLYTLKFNPVTGDHGENLAFWANTPSGEFKFSTVNEAAARFFDFGREYYLDFTLAPLA